MTDNMKTIMILTLLLGLIPGSAAGTGPGKSIKSFKRKMAAKLYLTACNWAASDPSIPSGLKIQAVQLFWIPPSLDGKCLGKKIEDCKVLEQRNRINKNESPRRILYEWVEQPKLIEYLLMSGGIARFIGEELGPDGPGVKTSAILSQNAIVRARVILEFWPNGENFKVIEFLKD